MILPDAEIRARLRDDVKAAWGVTRVHYDPPQVADSNSVLPRAFITLVDGESEPTGGAAAARDVVMPLTYELTGQFVWPASGTLEEAKVSKVNVLLAILTTNYPRYAGWRYRENIGWAFPPELQQMESAYSVTVTFTVEAIVKAGG